MAKNEEKSLLEIAGELMEKKRGPQHIDTIVKEVMSLKGYKVAEAKEKDTLKEGMNNDKSPFG